MISRVEILPTIDCFIFFKKELSGELKGSGNSLDFGARIYDSRLGRWMSVDPLTKEYPKTTPYHFVKNKPIFLKDIDGKDAIVTIRTEQKYFLFFKWEKRTIIISANYHYIEGQFDENVLQSVQEQWNNPKRKLKCIYQGQKYNVEFNIMFVPHPEGTELNYTGEGGENNLIVDNTISSPELSYYSTIEINMDMVSPQEFRNDNNESFFAELTPVQQTNRLVSTIGHGIGHNIGMRHSDLGIMNDQLTFIHPKHANSSQGSIVPAMNIRLNNNYKYNVQYLINRIDAMTEQGRDFWADQIEIDDSGREQSLRDSGISTIIRNEETSELD